MCSVSPVNTGLNATFGSTRILGLNVSDDVHLSSTVFLSAMNEISHYIIGLIICTLEVLLFSNILGEVIRHGIMDNLNEFS